MRDLQEQNEGGPNPMWLEVRALIDSQLLASEIMSEVLSAARRVQNAPDCIPMHDVFLSMQLQSRQGNSAGVGIFLSGIPSLPPRGDDVLLYWGFGRKGGGGGGVGCDLHQTAGSSFQELYLWTDIQPSRCQNPLSGTLCSLCMARNQI